MSASVKAYFALKMMGDDVDAPHMRRAREAILARGGAIHANVFTRCLLSLYGVLSWKSVPVMPVEIMLLPAWFPFHLTKISYWARTVIVPLLVLQALKPRARNPRGIGIDELFAENPRDIGPPRRAPHQSAGWFAFFQAIDVVLRAAEPWFPAGPRRRAIARAVAFVTERLNGEDGLGAIFPAMANSVMMFAVLGYPEEHPDRAVARASLDKLVVIGDEEGYCQPCVSPVWDTALVCHTLLEAGDKRSVASVRRGLQWLLPKQELEVKGDWVARRPQLRPGGWALPTMPIPTIPISTSTAVVVMAMKTACAGSNRPEEFDSADRAGRANGSGGMQSRQWRVRRVRRRQYALPPQQHPVLGSRRIARSADRGRHRPTSVDARSPKLGERAGENVDVDRAIAYLRDTQLPDGSWYGRWGMNYIYGTWSVLCALNAAGLDPQSDVMRKAADWLIAIQNPDGGWGEDAISYKLDYRGYEAAPSTASQTAWALLGLMSAGRADHPAVRRGIAYLAATQASDGFWNEPRFTATGFPRVFYLRYHGYRRFFPLWALARYRNPAGDQQLGAVATFGM